MFKSQNFCHVASNNRNNLKVGVFIYRTTDDLATVLTSGYFNDRIIDINLHDIIIHEKIDASDNTKVEKNILCVIERTLSNVGATVVKSKWEKDIEEIIENLGDGFVKTDGTSIMSAPLKFESGSMRGAVGPYLNGVSFWKMDAQGAITNYANFTDSRFWPVTTNAIDLGRSANTWKDLYLGGKAYVPTINNGADLTVPNKSGVLATTADVELAASSGRMLTNQGVWYAKMYSATVAPSAEDGTNYADFSQVDNDNNPIIVIYTRTSGAWVQSQTITPPADYDGYVTITSKIWDIAEQSGQQGGRVLWNHTSKEFTPYPQIISFDNISITGTSTVVMPNNPSSTQIVNKNYVDSQISDIENQILAKADTDLSNLTNTGKSNVLAWGIPDYASGTNITTPNNYTVPEYGEIRLHFVRTSTGSGTCTITIDGTSITGVSNNYTDVYQTFPVKKGSIISITSSDISIWDATFYPYTL